MGEIPDILYIEMYSQRQEVREVGFRSPWSNCAYPQCYPGGCLFQKYPIRKTGPHLITQRNFCSTLLLRQDHLYILPWYSYLQTNMTLITIIRPLKMMLKGSPKCRAVLMDGCNETKGLDYSEQTFSKGCREPVQVTDICSPLCLIMSHRSPWLTTWLYPTVLLYPKGRKS